MTNRFQPGEIVWTVNQSGEASAEIVFSVQPKQNEYNQITDMFYSTRQAYDYEGKNLFPNRKESNLHRISAGDRFLCRVLWFIHLLDLKAWTFLLRNRKKRWAKIVIGVKLLFYQNYFREILFFYREFLNPSPFSEMCLQILNKQVSARNSARKSARQKQAKSARKHIKNGRSKSLSIKNFNPVALKLYLTDTYMYAENWDGLSELSKLLKEQYNIKISRDKLFTLRKCVNEIGISTAKKYLKTLEEK